MMNPQESDIKSLEEFEAEQKKILSVIKSKGKRLPACRNEGYMGFGLKSLQEATMNGTVVIDHICVLSYPLDHEMTSPVLKALYLAQEELMMQEEDRPEEELSSPAKEQDQDITSMAIGPLKTVSAENLAVMKEQNWSYLHKIFPELNS